MPLSISDNTQIFFPPGMMGRGEYANRSLGLGRQIRDEWLWELPLLPGAVETYVAMAAGREWRVSGPPKQVNRAVSWLNDAVVYNSDGTVERGWFPFQARRVMDSLTVGRTLADIEDELEYLDPVDWYYDLQKNRWVSTVIDRFVKPENMLVYHPIPLGASGRFRAPLSSLMPTAMLAWLIREHDRAAADGRKIRDILLVLGRETATQIGEAIESSVKLWSGASVTEAGVPIVYVENMSGNAQAAEDHVTRIGIANIPEGFNRSDFQFEYVNEIASTLGLSLRHFWNSEKATNRALEEVQEARQALKGPSAYVRNEQALLRDRRVLARRFGSNVRMAFIEEVDSQSKESNAKVLKLYADSLTQFATTFGGTINGEAFLGWLQRDGILPSDIDLITDSGTIATPTELETPDGETRIMDGDGASAEKTLDYGEITLDMHGRVVDIRRKTFTIEKAIARELRAEKQPEVATSPSTEFVTLLREAREKNKQEFFSRYHASSDVLNETEAPEAFLDGLFEKSKSKDDLTVEEHRFISSFMRDRQLRKEQEPK